MKYVRFWKYRLGIDEIICLALLPVFLFLLGKYRWEAFVGLVIVAIVANVGWPAAGLWHDFKNRRGRKGE